MRRGFDNNGEYSVLYNSLERETIRRLAKIEQEDANTCAGCGGEDCMCCEIYHDRQQWVSSDALFGCDDDGYYDYY